MYKIEIKKLEEKKWKGVPVNDIIGKSLLEYIDDEKQPVVAALFEDEETKAVITNSEKYLKNYKKKYPKALVSLAWWLRDLMTNSVGIPLIGAALPDSRIKEIKVDDGNL